MRDPIEDLFDLSTPMGKKIAASLAARDAEMAAYEAAIDAADATNITTTSAVVESAHFCPFCGQGFVGSDLVFRVGNEPYPEQYGYAHQSCWSAVEDGGMTHQAPPIIGPNAVQERGGWFSVKLLSNGDKLYFATGDR